MPLVDLVRNENIQPPQTEEELLMRTEKLTGKTLGHIIHLVETNTQSVKKHHKGAIGQYFERLLGADAGNATTPDFTALNIELKTLPIGKNERPTESTFVTVIALTQIHQETWETSHVSKKLNRVLWIPIEGDREIPLHERRIGQAFLWSPNTEEYAILKNDWDELTNHIALGELENISAKSGIALQIRPKGANGRSLSWSLDQRGNKIKTLPRGFYLRASFTHELYNKHFKN